MIRTYRRTQLPDGTVVVESHGPVSRAWRGTRVVWGSLWLIAAVVALFQAQWSAAGICLLIGAVIIPSARKRP